jgi:hypothetical protein
MSPYRQPYVPEPAANADEEVDVCPDGELMPVLSIFWIASIVRVALGVAHHETFATEGTLAFLAVLAVPYLMRDAITWWLRRIWRRLSR